jgi:ABC-type protease/lipase transport system fused ATPase/permease subunit
MALARALYGRPKLLVLDEPNSNLDELGEQALNNSIIRMKAHGSTIIMVSHRQAVLSLADYVIILTAGRITEQGTREDVIAKAQAAQKAKLISASAAPVEGGGAR